jgi:hypothetical protein
MDNLLPALSDYVPQHVECPNWSDNFLSRQIKLGSAGTNESELLEIISIEF